MSSWRTGIVHFWDPDKGQGMIIDSEDGDFIFVHYSAIESQEKYKNLIRNQRVEFQTYKNIYSEKVRKVKVIQEAL